jgi:hypothetical protein
MVPFYWKRNTYYCCGFRVPCVASFCGLPIFYCPFGFLYHLFYYRWFNSNLDETHNSGRLALGRRRDRMVVGFTTTCAISAYHHYSCEFEPHS